jgi:hypothetical protein
MMVDFCVVMLIPLNAVDTRRLTELRSRQLGCHLPGDDECAETLASAGILLAYRDHCQF